MEGFGSHRLGGRPRDHAFPKAVAYVIRYPRPGGFPRNLALRRLKKSFSKPLNTSHSLLYPFKIP